MSTEDNIRAAARITAEIRAKEREAIEGLIQTWTCGPQPARVGDLFEAIRARGQASEAHDTADEAAITTGRLMQAALRMPSSVLVSPAAAPTLLAERDALRAEIAHLAKSTKAENERVKAERDALRLRFQAVAELVVTLDDAVQRGAGCCEAGRGSRLRQIRAEVEKTERADWAPSFEDRISEAWTERDALKAALEVERHNHQQALDACDALLAERDELRRIGRRLADDCALARDERDELRAENARLRAALEAILENSATLYAREVAREALAKVAP